jgi:MATE family multidrug resistance protein
VFGAESSPTDADQQQHPPGETSPLLAGAAGVPSSPGDQQPSDHDVEQQWEQALAAGQIHSSWQREAKTIATYSGPLIVTFFLQYSINVASIFAVGRIGTMELGAVSRMSNPLSLSPPSTTPSPFYRV